MRAYRVAHSDKLRRVDRERYARVKDDPEFRASERKRGLDEYRRLRDEVFQAYGGYRCSCECGCGVTEPLFLELDHIADDGAEHRRALGYKGNGKGAVYSVYRDLKREGYPPVVRVLCSNCNKGSFRNGGTCPATRCKPSELLETLKD